MNLTGENLIAGRPAAGGGKAFSAFNPVSGETLATGFREATLDQLQLAAAAAHEAFQTYRRLSGGRRADLLEAIAGQLEAGADALIARCGAESGLPVARLKGELARTTGQLRLFAGVVRDGSWVDARTDPALPDRQPQPRPELRRTLIPLGPVAVFGASNFPFAFSVAGGDTASALAAGCPVIGKGHPAHPGTCELAGRAIAQAVAQCGLPGGVFSLLHGGPELGLALVRHPAITAVGFTGSRQAGRALFDAAASRPAPIPVMAEMSSVNPLLILPGALHAREAALAQGLAGSVMLGSGQFCTKPGIIFIPGGAGGEAFTAKLEAAFAASAALPLLTAGIQTAFNAGVGRLKARSEVSLRGGQGAATGAGTPVPHTGVNPIFAATTAEAFCRLHDLREEIFGPFTLVVSVESPAELMACLDRLEGQLTATVHAAESDWPQVEALLPRLEQLAGRLIFNGFPTGVEVTAAMNHGGPYPATSDVRFTSVGSAAILRFARPICYQNFPEPLLPAALRAAPAPAR